MRILVAFAPFIAFAGLDRAIGPLPGLAAGALIALALLIRDWVTPGRSPKVLEIGTGILFGGLALVAAFGGAAWSIIGVRLRVDAGLLLIVLTSWAVRRPFTLQYARESVERAQWYSDEFIRANYVITAVWALAFLVLVIADLVWLYMPALPPRLGVIMTILALVGAVKFTTWYPERAQVLQPAAPSE